MQEEKKDEAENCVFIGKKTTMSYVFAVTTQAQSQKEIRIRARGRSISKAVDVSQIAMHRFLKGWNLKEVLIGTQEKKPEPKPEDKESNSKGEDQLDRVSFIDIIIELKETGK